MLKSFDHATLLISDLDRATAAFRDLGFDVFSREDGSTSNMQNRLIRFADGSFIELVSFRDRLAADPHRFWPLLAIGDGWIDYAVKVSELDHYASSLKCLSVPSSGKRSIRKARRDGDDWVADLLIAGRGIGHPGLPFLIEDRTPAAWRTPVLAPSEQQPHGALGISGVTVLAGHIDAMEAGMRAIFGAGREIAPRSEDVRAGLRYDFNGRWVELLEPAIRTSALRDHLATWGGGVYEVTLATGNHRTSSPWSVADTCHGSLKLSAGSLPASLVSS